MGDLWNTAFIILCKNYIKATDVNGKIEVNNVMPILHFLAVY
jgi:hypothetical protein